MMTLTMALLTVSSFFLWWGKARWGWLTVMAALILGIIIFAQDFDFLWNLGIQL